MALSREEIEAIAKEVADRIAPKAQACRCGLAMWEVREREEFFKAIIENKYIPWLGNMPHLMEVSLSNAEQMCGIDMKKPKELLKDLQRNIEAEDWRDADVTIALLHGSIVGPLKEGAEGSNPGNPGRVRYDRANIDSTIEAAKRLKSDRNLYVFATAYGFTIDKSKPPGTQRYYIVHPDGTTELIDPYKDIRSDSQINVEWEQLEPDWWTLREKIPHKGRVYDVEIVEIREEYEPRITMTTGAGVTSVVSLKATDTLESAKRDAIKTIYGES